MPSLDKRREVAARLRDFENLRPTFKDSVLCGFLEALDVGYLDWEGVCNSLADLIEPEPEKTCHLFVQNKSYYLSCCGYWIDDSWYLFRPNYCPYCGAKVID